MALHLAVIPRLSGSNLTVTIEPANGVRSSANTLRAQLAEGQLAYRQQLSVTRDANGPAEMVILVTMDGADGRISRRFSLPLTVHAG